MVDFLYIQIYNLTLVSDIKNGVNSLKMKAVAVELQQLFIVPAF